ncbi:MAG: hypothetical protein C6W55_14050 [Thermobacillus sp.]|uniref:Uncharacterized protein n=1 Tax=Thermobacillus composti (strain DSM 18247 / JCM 13945 / KWC4) TaxID=717605 RepID=L0EE00_THECK|nr:MULTISPECIES: hypothetical protein [Thermobacillus]AGA58518.1 hypothetical protein Theco_2410 [Thermobacillus composti KWC4]REK53334.1 MAG: hypothetical protein C6W55_14050 [Thermobacillus sp.]
MRKPWQYTLLGAVIAFFVLYGIELSSDGMEDVYGPLEQQAADRAGTGSGNGHEYGDPYPAGKRGTAAAQPDPYDPWSGAYGESGAGIDPERDDVGALPDGNDGYGYSYEGAAEGGGAVSRLADGTAGLLQSVAKGGIRLIVSLFESVTK